MNELYAGEDKKIFLTVSDADGLIDLTGFDNVLCHIVNSKNEVVAKFSRSVLAGYLSMTAVGLNVLEIALKREITELFERDNYKIEVITKKVDGDFPAQFKSIGVIFAFKVVKPSTESIDL